MTHSGQRKPLEYPALSLLMLPVSLVAAAAVLFFIWQNPSSDADRAKAWIEVPAQISGAKTLEDGILRIHYEFTHEGNQHYGNARRLSLWFNLPSTIDEAAAIDALLSDFENGIVATTAWVDTANPSRTALFYDLDDTKVQTPILLKLAVILGIAGIVAMIWFIGRLLKSFLEQQRARRHPDEPWLWRTVWADGRVQNNARQTMIANLGWSFIPLILAVVFVSMIVLTFLDETVDLSFGGGSALVIIALSMSAAALYALRKFYRSIGHWRIWGSSVFQLQPGPFFLGETSSGNIVLPADVGSDHLTYQLGCYRVIRTFTGRATQEQSTTLWESDPQTKQIAHGAATVPLTFDLPKSRPDSSWHDRFEQVRWRLNVRVGDEKLSYDMPVFGRD